MTHPKQLDTVQRYKQNNNHDDDDDDNDDDDSCSTRYTTES
jgi:hypothetical protein